MAHRNRDSYPTTKTSYDRIPYGPYKGKTIGYMADNHPHELEAWAAGRNIAFSRDIAERIKAAKNLGR